MIHWAWLIPTIFVSFTLGMLLMAMMADAKARDKGAGRGDRDLWPEYEMTERKLRG